MDGIVEPERSKDHAEQPPCEDSGSGRLLPGADELFHRLHNLDRHGDRLFDHLGALLEHVRLQSQETLVLEAGELDCQSRANPLHGRSQRRDDCGPAL